VRGGARGRAQGGVAAYRDDAPQSLEDVSLGAAVEELLELARGQHLGGGPAARIGGVAGGFEGQVAGCSKRPVSKVGRVHGWRRRAWVRLERLRSRRRGVWADAPMREMDSMASRRAPAEAHADKVCYTGRLGRGRLCRQRRGGGCA
jgi:hypothetical protein